MLICTCCKQDVDDVRFGVCWDCACAGEERAARRGVLGHCAKGVRNTLRGNFSNARFDFKWAWERLTRTGDYAPGGEFESQYGV